MLKQSISNQSISGFTLIELLIALSIFYIITSIAIPSMANTLSTVRHNGSLTVLFSQLQLARSRAIINNQTLIMCKSKNLKQCEADVEWSDGWLVFADKNQNKQFDSDEKLIFKQHRLKGANKIIYKSFSGSDEYVLFYARGFSHTNGTFLFCHEYHAEQSKAVIISRTGRIRTNDELSTTSINKCLPYEKTS
ncbi:MAG: GspH/FimT family pseudopilin [Gammaproteobacteria bacterium]|nr:GspH/FimT family pseudopilin [Gammaproteobacteria bacterium]